MVLDRLRKFRGSGSWEASDLCKKVALICSYSIVFYGQRFESRLEQVAVCSLLKLCSDPAAV